MLVLVRKTGEKVLFSENGAQFMTFKLVGVSSTECRFKVTLPAINHIYEITVHRLDSYRLSEDVELTVVAISRGHVKLGFEAPKSIRIMRSELTDSATK